MIRRSLAAVPTAAFAAALLVSGSAPHVARADGAASTRHIILGGAAATAGTLIWLNHNKKVHEKYAEYDRRQAATAAQANQAEAAYESERSAYAHEAALVDQYQRTVTYQHGQVVARDREIASLEHSLRVAKSRAAAPAVAAVPAAAAVPVTADRTRVADAPRETPVSGASWGWGRY